MSRSRAAKSRIFNWVAQMFVGSASTRDETAARMAQVTAAIYRREASGETTRLRQLHKIADLSQPQALTAVDELLRAEAIEIELNVADRFESTISLTEGARRRLDRAMKGRAA